MERLTRNQQKIQKKQTRTILFILGFLLVVMIVFFMYGVQILINLSLFLEKMKGGQSVTTSTADTLYIAPPMINPMENATKSAQISISGYSLPAYTVKLYVNGDMKKSEKISGDKTFNFQNVPLQEGKNEIRAKAITEDGKESTYSDTITVSYIHKAPSLTIDAPSDGQTFSGSDNQIKVTGSTDPNVKVTVNDFWAIVNDNGQFSYLLQLHKGENQIKVIATDSAGNQTTKELKVTLND